MSLPETFLLQIDGAGALLVTTRERIVLGPVGASRAPDLALVAGPGTPPLTIRRAEEDYFAESPIRTLLRDGQKIELSPRCRLRFRRPNPASTSAVLEVTSGRLAGCDARRVILLDGEMLIGPGRACHIVAPLLRHSMILQHRGGRLVLRDGSGTAAELARGVPARAGELGIVWTEAPS